MFIENFNGKLDIEQAEYDKLKKYINKYEKFFSYHLEKLHKIIIQKNYVLSYDIYKEFENEYLFWKDTKYLSQKEDGFWDENNHLWIETVITKLKCEIHELESSISLDTEFIKEKESILDIINR